MESLTHRFIKGEPFFCPECGYRIISLDKDNFGTCIRGHIHKIEEE